jgi:hypothetical protein
VLISVICCCLLELQLHAVATTTLHCCADAESKPSPLVLVNTSDKAVSLYIHELEVDALYYAERKGGELAPALSIELQQPLHLLLPPASHAELRQVQILAHDMHGMAITAHTTAEFGSASGYGKDTESAELYKNDQQQQPLHTAAGHRRALQQQGPKRKPWSLVERGSGATSAAAASSSGCPPVTAATGPTSAPAATTAAATGGDNSAATAATTATAGASAVTAQQQQQQQQRAVSRALRLTTAAFVAKLWQLAGTDTTAAAVQRRDRAVSSTLTLAIQHITGRYSSAGADSTTAAALVQLRLDCNPLWPVLQLVLQLQQALVYRNRRQTALADRGLTAGSAQSRVLRQTISVVNMLRPATEHDLDLCGYEQLNRIAELLVPQTSSSARNGDGYATTTLLKMGLPPPKLSGKRF